MDPGIDVQECKALIADIKSVSNAHPTETQSLELIEGKLSGSVHRNVQSWSGSPQSYNEVLNLLTSHAYEAFTHNCNYFALLIERLASATRTKAAWRSCFGHSSTSGDDKADLETYVPKPDCILEVARRVCLQQYPTPSAAVTNALRIIANCCADNNDNRRLIIHRDGIGVLFKLIDTSIDLDVLVPALYNVCVDYDEPATFSVPAVSGGAPSEDVSMGTTSDQEYRIPSLSIQYLAAATRSNREYMAFEKLLSLQTRVSESVLSYLAELVELATQPAVSGFQHMQLDDTQDNAAWSWSYVIDSKSYDTVAQLVEFGHRNPECWGHTCRAILNLLSQPIPRDALLERGDGSLWMFATLFCSQSEAETDSASSSEETSASREAFLKVLYQMTGDSAFHENQAISPALFPHCLGQLRKAISRDRNGQYTWRDQQSDMIGLKAPSSLQTYADSEMSLLAIACIIISQLLISAKVRDQLLDDGILLHVLAILFKYEVDPNILYPAISIVSRLLLSSRPVLLFVQHNILANMQRLLTAKGLGLIVPFEAVAAYKNFMRGRSEYIEPFLTISDSSQQTVISDILFLYYKTVEAGTKLEIGKFFIELLRSTLATPTMASTRTKETTMTATKSTTNISGSTASVVSPVLPVSQSARTHTPPREQLGSFLETTPKTAADISAVFTWVITSAEPASQRQHGWFGLAMLSTWDQSHSGIVQFLAESAELRDAISATASSTTPPTPMTNAVRGNLMLFLKQLTSSSSSSKLASASGLGSRSDERYPAVVRDTLKSATENLGINLVV